MANRRARRRGRAKSTSGGPAWGAKPAARKAALVAAGVGIGVGSPALLGFLTSAAGAAPSAASSTPLAQTGYPSDTTITYAPGVNGALQEAFVVRDGYVSWRYEEPDGAWTTWAQLGTQITPDQVAVTWAPGSNGSTQEIFADTNGAVVVKWQSGGTWTATWVSLGTASLGFAQSEVTYAPGTGGAVQDIFATAGTTIHGTTYGYTEAYGYVYEDSEAPGGTWSGWHPVADKRFYSYPLGTFATGHLTWAPGSNGSTQELFAVTTGTGPTSGTVFVTWQTADGTWVTWRPLDSQPGDVEAPVTYAPGSEGSLQEVFAVDDDDTALVDWENPDGSWSGWVSEGRPATSSSEYFEEYDAITYAPGSNGSTQEIFATTSETGTAWVKWETAGAWSPWTDLYGENFRYNKGVELLTYAPGSNGSLQELFATSDTLSSTDTYPIYVAWENPGGSWSPWTYFGTPPHT